MPLGALKISVLGVLMVGPRAPSHMGVLLDSEVFPRYRGGWNQGHPGPAMMGQNNPIGSNV